MAIYNPSGALTASSLNSSSQSQDLKIAFMPIKPVYAELLIDGKKQFEYRRSAISFDLTHMIVYASSPVKKVLGVVAVNRVCIASPEETWATTKQYAGIKQRAFQKYFLNSDIAYSIEIEPKATLKLNRQISPKEIDPNFQVPQSFKYVSLDFLNQVLRLGSEE